MSSGLYAINPSQQLLPHKHLKHLDHSLIHPYINDRTQLWSSVSKVCIHKIQMMQSKAVRPIIMSKYNESTLPNK